MRDPGNILEVGALCPDYMGFIFYSGSKRYAGDLDPLVLAQLPESVQRTGVFVNSPRKEVEALVARYRLDAVQLHGTESPDDCQAIRSLGVTVIKAFGISEAFAFAQTEEYAGVVDFFLFDTSTPEFGGSGKTFNWSLLGQYTGSTRYFLSGGIGVEELTNFVPVNDDRLVAFDINSRVESVPGCKDLDKIKRVKELIMRLR